MKRRDILLMLVPCLFFVGVALWMRAREARLPPDDGQFHLLIEKIEVKPISAKDAADGYDTQVVATLKHSGPEPNWWGKQSGTYADGAGPSHLFLEGNSKKKLLDKIPLYYWRPGWDDPTKRYKAHFLLQLAPLPKSAEKTVLHANVFIEDGSGGSKKPLCDAIPLTFTVREPNQTIKTPQVSRDPQLKVRKVTITKHSAAQQKSSGSLDTTVIIELFDQGIGEDGDTMGGSDFVDEKGQSIKSNRGWSYSSGTMGSEPRHPQLHLEATLKSVPAREKNIFFKTKYSRADRWPLEIRVPLRKNGKNLSGDVTSQTQSAPVPPHK